MPRTYMALLVGLSMQTACAQPRTAAKRCDAGYSDSCFQAALEAPDMQGRSHFMNLGGAYGEAACKAEIRDGMGAPWGKNGPADAGPALHAFGVFCNEGYPAACFEVGNWLMFDFVSPAAAVAPYRVACTEKFEDACKRLKIAETLAAAPPTNRAPPSWMELTGRIREMQ